MSSSLERALLCERLGWRILPHELDEVELEKLLGPLHELHVYRTFQTYARDMKLLDEEQVELVASVEQMRDLTPGPSP